MQFSKCLTMSSQLQATSYSLCTLRRLHVELQYQNDRMQVLATRKLQVWRQVFISLLSSGHHKLTIRQISASLSTRAHPRTDDKMRQETHFHR